MGGDAFLCPLLSAADGCPMPIGQGGVGAEGEVASNVSFCFAAPAWGWSVNAALLLTRGLQ